MADRDLTIAIRVTGDITGVTTVNQALDGLAAKAGQAGATVTTVLDTAAFTATSTTTPAVRTVTDALNATGGAATGAGAAASGAMNQTGAAASGAAPAVRSVTDALNASASAGTAAGAANVAALERQLRSLMAFLDALRRTNAEQGRMAGSASMANDARAQAAMWMDLNNRVLTVVPALKQAGTATANVSQGMGQARKSTFDFGQAALQASFFVDDLQYGIRGWVNNVPLLAMSMGLGGGLAGIISILAVAVNQLDQKFDLFGSKAGKALEAAKNAVIETGKAADAAKDTASKAAEADTVWHDHMRTLDEVAEKYRVLTEKISDNRAERERLNRLTLEETDAQAAADLAEIEARRTEGNMSDTDAEVASRKVRAGAQKKKFDLEQEDLKKREEELKTDAAGKQDVLDTNTKVDKEQREATANLLTKADREAISKQADELLQLVKTEQEKLKNAPSTIRGLPEEERLRRFPTAPLNTVNPDLEKFRQNIADYNERYEKVRERLVLDSEAQVNPFKITDANEERKRQEEFDKWQKEQNRAIDRDKRDAELTGKERGARTRIFSANTKAEDQQSATRITSIQDREDQEREKDREAEEKRQDQEQKKAEQAQKKADTADRNVGRGIATQTSYYTRGKKGSKIQELTDRANDLRDGIDAGELEAFERALRQLANTLNARKDRDKDLLSKLLRTVEAIEKQQKNSRQ